MSYLKDVFINIKDSVEDAIKQAKIEKMENKLLREDMLNEVYYDLLLECKKDIINRCKDRFFDDKLEQSLAKGVPFDSKREKEILGRNGKVIQFSYSMDAAKQNAFTTDCGGFVKKALDHNRTMLQKYEPEIGHNPIFKQEHYELQMAFANNGAAGIVNYVDELSKKYTGEGLARNHDINIDNLEPGMFLAFQKIKGGTGKNKANIPDENRVDHIVMIVEENGKKYAVEANSSKLGYVKTELDVYLYGGGRNSKGIPQKGVLNEIGEKYNYVVASDPLIGAKTRLVNQEMKNIDKEELLNKAELIVNQRLQNQNNRENNINQDYDLRSQHEIYVKNNNDIQIKYKENLDNEQQNQQENNLNQQLAKMRTV